jgi:pimeloyl-ACP methyl ester carboxylesterase
MPLVNVNGTPLYYASIGSGPPLLLIHGTGGDGTAFEAVTNDLARTYTVIAYDRRAFSRSKGKPHAPRNYLAAHGSDAAALLSAIGAGPAHVLGWSAGGLVALALALERPDLVKNLLLYEPPYLAKSKASIGFIFNFAQIMALRTLGLRRAAAAKFFRTVFARRDGRNDFDALPAALRQTMLASAGALLAELDGGTGEEFEAHALRGLRPPTTLFTGAQSAPLFAAAAERLAKAVPLSRRISARNGGHILQATDPTGFVQIVGDILRS